jgi:hypothetical protein
MRQNTRPDDLNGFLLVKLEPSNRLPRSGIFMLVNDHYMFDGATDSSEAMEVIESRWEGSLQYSEFIVNCIMKNFVEQKS